MQLPRARLAVVLLSVVQKFVVLKINSYGSQGLDFKTHSLQGVFAAHAKFSKTLWASSSIDAESSDRIRIGHEGFKIDLKYMYIVCGA